jgi:hypothetical protein
LEVDRGDAGREGAEGDTGHAEIAAGRLARSKGARGVGDLPRAVIHRILQRCFEGAGIRLDGRGRITGVRIDDLEQGVGEGQVALLAHHLVGATVDAQIEGERGTLGHCNAAGEEMGEGVGHDGRRLRAGRAGGLRIPGG